MMLLDVFDDEDDDSAPELDRLHGLWVDQVRGSTICVDARTRPVRAPYCSGGGDLLTGVFESWRHRGGHFFCKFRWLDRPIRGYLVLRSESHDTMAGGWWYEQDVPRHQVNMLPFLPGIHPCVWDRQPGKKPWPRWGAEFLGQGDGPITTASIPLPQARRTELEINLDMRTAEGRYRRRVLDWIGPSRGLARVGERLGHHGWWLLHNLVAHPLLGLAVNHRSVALHDWTSRRLHRQTYAPAPSPSPVVERRFWWVVHNLFAHAAIGLVPCEATFRWHDASARRMQVPGWA
jgi:hypothetical protein